jgi:preprotein translocase subunit SecF
MQFIKPDINVDFIGKRKIAYTVSAIMILISIASLIVHKGPRYGIDFAGGSLVQVRFKAPVEIDTIKSGLAAMDLSQSSVQQFGEKKDNEYLIRTDRSVTTDGAFSHNLETNLKNATGQDAEIRRVEMVGPQVGQSLREKALYAIFFSLLFIAIYISGRFELKWMLSGLVAAALAGGVYLLSILHLSVPIMIAAALIITLLLFWFLELKYAMGAIVALIHDVLITVGLFSIFDKEFSLSIIAALLTIIGYSLNDSIVIYDRIRENLRKYHKSPLPVIINRSVNETLSRTILTGGMTLVVLVALFFLGGSIIRDFTFAMIVGIVVGTYSSVYVASPILLAWQNRK